MIMQNSRSSVLKNSLVLLFVSVLAACGTSKKNSGGYYQDDGPGNKRVNIDAVPNATPRAEPFNKATLRPYVVNGKRYVPLMSAEGFLEEGRASWYGKKYHGRKTSTGEVYDMYKMTAAHPTLPLPSYVRVTNVVNQRSVIVRVNDRGPFIGNRIVDLSYVAARKLGVVSSGTGNVIVESLSTYIPSTVTSRSNAAQKTTNSRVNIDTSVKPQGEILAAGKDNPNYRYSLPSSSQSIPPSSPQSELQSSSPQSPQLIPSYGDSSTNVNNTSGQTNQSANRTPQQAQQQYSKNNPQQNNPQQYQQAQPRFSAGQWIQVGAFSSRQNAEKLVSRLNVSGYQNTQVKPLNSLFKVLVGPISQKQVGATQRSLKTNGYSAILVKP